MSEDVSASKCRLCKADLGPDPVDHHFLPIVGGQIEVCLNCFLHPAKKNTNYLKGLRREARKTIQKGV